MENELDFQSAEQVAAVDRAQQKNGPGGRIKQLGLRIRVERNTAVAVRIPERQLAVSQAGRDKPGKRLG